MGYHNAPKALQEKYYIQIEHVSTGNKVRFVCFLKNFSDKYDSNWQEEDVYGRMDPILTYTGTKRTISLGWDVVAASIEEAKRNLQKAQKMARMFYPHYDNSSLTTPPYFKLKVMNFARDDNGAPLLGVIKNFQFNPSFELDHFLEGGRAYPKLIEMSTEFTVLHRQVPGYDASGGSLPGFKNYPYGFTVKDDEKTPAAGARNGSANGQNETVPEPAREQGMKYTDAENRESSVSESVMTNPTATAARTPTAEQPNASIPRGETKEDTN